MQAKAAALGLVLLWQLCSAPAAASRIFLPDSGFCLCPAGFFDSSKSPAGWAGCSTVLDVDIKYYEGCVTEWESTRPGDLQYAQDACCAQAEPCSDLLTSHPPYLVATAEGWDAANQRFEDMSGNGRHGVLVAGSVDQGVVSGNGAQVVVPYVGGTIATKIDWPAPATFTICSVTRYSGDFMHRILQAKETNWYHDY
jgi:hypothetical protein